MCDDLATGKIALETHLPRGAKDATHGAAGLGGDAGGAALVVAHEHAFDFAPIGKLEQIVNEAEDFVINSPERERKTSEIGELIMNRLRRHDKVAYVRFASVYLDFKDVGEFMSELKDLLKVKDTPTPVKPKTTGAKTQ